MVSKQGSRRRGVRQNNARRFKASANNAVNGISGFISRAGINTMFNTSQIPDNPGYVDFNEPTVPVIPPIPAKIKGNKNERFNRRGEGQKGRGRNQRSKPWSVNNRIPGQIAAFPPLPPPLGRNFRNAPVPRLGGGRLIPPPLPPMAMRPPILPPIPLPNNRRFGLRPLGPPQMAGVLMPPPLMPPRGPPIHLGPMLPLPILPRGAPLAPGPIRRNKNIHINKKHEGKNRRRAPSRSAQKNKSTKKTLNEIVNQYPLDKPWVTDKIKEEHKKKDEIENKLKGNRDDKLFAEFKMQRDKFVKLYEAARLEYIGKHSEQDVEKIMTESDKAKAENAKAKSNENQIKQIAVVVTNNNNHTTKANEIDKANEKPKQAVIANDTPKAIDNVAKPRATRARGKLNAK